MLTARGWWLLVFVLTLLAMGGLFALRGPTTVLVMGLTLFVWFVIEWAVFAIQAKIAVRKLSIERDLQDERGQVATF
jgi:hypothetical protein